MTKTTPFVVVCLVVISLVALLGGYQAKAPSVSKCILDCASSRVASSKNNAMYKCVRSCVPPSSNVAHSDQVLLNKYLARQIEPLIVALEEEPGVLSENSILNHLKTKLKKCLTNVFDRIKDAKCKLLSKKPGCPNGQTLVSVDKKIKIHARYPEFICKVWECQKKPTPCGTQPPACECQAGYSPSIVTGSDGCQKCECQKIPCPVESPCESKTCPVNHDPFVVPAVNANSCPTCECRKRPCPELNCEQHTCPDNHNPFVAPAVDENSCPTCGCEKRPCPTLDCDSTCPANTDPFVVPAVNENSCPTCECRKKPCPPLVCDATSCPAHQEAFLVPAVNEDSCPTCECRDKPLTCPAPCQSTTCQTGYTPKEVAAVDENSCSTCQCEKVVCKIRDCYAYCYGSPFDSYYDADGCLACSCYGALNDLYTGKKGNKRFGRVSKKRAASHGRRRRE